MSTSQAVGTRRGRTVLRGRGGGRPRWFVGWLFVLPLLAGIAVLYLWPIVQTLIFSASTFGPFGGHQKFVGLDNYRQLFDSGDVPGALAHTLLYSLMVLLAIPISVGLASLLNLPGLRFANFYKMMFFMPFVAMPVAISMVWRYLYNGDYGLFSYLVMRLGGPRIYWLSTPGWALFAVGLVGLWGAQGFNLIILSAGMKASPAELYEAAQLDGATPWRQFTHVTVPLLTPSIFFLTITNLISALQLFDALFMMLGTTNPVMPQTRSLVYLFYEAGFLDNRQGYAAAIAIVIVVIIGLITGVQFWLQRRWVTYG